MQYEGNDAITRNSTRLASQPFFLSNRISTRIAAVIISSLAPLDLHRQRDQVTEASLSACGRLPLPLLGSAGEICISPGRNCSVIGVIRRSPISNSFKGKVKISSTICKGDSTGSYMFGWVADKWALLQMNFLEGTWGTRGNAEGKGQGEMFL